MKNYRLIAYALDFTSFLIENLKKMDLIENIILFGSVSRFEAEKNSDIDIFIDTKHELNKEINLIVEKFYESLKFNKYWKLLGITNQLNLSIGKLDNWDLKRSIVSNGIVLYGSYKSSEKSKGFSLITLNISGNRNSKMKAWRKLYGYTQKTNDKSYELKGLIDLFNGKKLGKAVFIIPMQNTQKIKYFLNENKIKYEIIDFWTDSI